MTERKLFVAVFVMLLMLVAFAVALAKAGVPLALALGGTSVLAALLAWAVVNRARD